jgi:hypothetical protein
MAEVPNYATPSNLGGGESGSRALSIRKAIFFASFMTLIAAGMGFGVRGAIVGDWGAEFGFTKSELGAILGAGLSGFGFTIIFFSFFADQVGYKLLLLGAFLLHVISAVITLLATPIFHASGKNATYWCLYIGTFIFSLGNGLCEAAINPLTATLFPKNKTHYLNILHAGWPGGLVIGGLLGYLFAGKTATLGHVRWEILLATYLLPAFYYGFVVLKNPFPISEAKAAGLSIGQMIGNVFAPLLLFLFLIHAMVGYVELGTDSWIQNILNNTIGNLAFLLFVYTSLLMFVLRFTAGPIVHRINPLGLLCIAACCGAIGLYLLGTVNGAILVFMAATIFALGKTFYWPTMLGVIGERFPRAGAIAMGLSGGIGMLSAGFLGGPGIGYTQDRNASSKLVQTDDAAYQRVASADKNGFLFFQPIQGLDGSKVAVITDKPTPAATLQDDLKKNPSDSNLQKLNQWYTTTEQPHVTSDEKPVSEAVIYGGRRALQITSFIPMAMAACYLLLVLYFIMRGGYKVVHLDPSGRELEVDHTAAEENAIEAVGPHEA